MLKGSIIDVYPDRKRNAMVTWIVDNGKSLKIEEKYLPSFFVYSNREDLLTIAGLLRESSEVEKLNFTFKSIYLGEEKKRFVLEIIPKNIGSIKELSKKIDSWGGFYRYSLFNVDTRLSSRYLQEKNLFCNQFVKYDGKKFSSDQKQWDIDYKTPSYKEAYFDVKRESNGKILSFNDKIKHIKINDFLIDGKNESDIIIDAVKEIKNIDPDVIYTYKGDSFVFPYILHRATINNIEKVVNLSREKKRLLKSFKKEKSYFSYGQIIYRPAFYVLYGRAHIDTYNSFMYGKSGLFGLIDISRCSNIPLQMLSRVGPGTAISQIQVNKAIEKGKLIPWKKNMPENWKTAMDLLISDRGGLILDPIVGIHENVIELDFASLYPNIMLKYNISPETMLCKCCRDSPKIIVPQLNYHICKKKTGLLPEVLEPIIKRRFLYKARAKNNSYEKELYKELQQAWKWVLLVCFGYTGYKNARFGRIECYESITAFSRKILLDAAGKAEESGYNVLHGIIDSLWIKPKKNALNPYLLSRAISNKIGINLDYEGRYKWIVFLPSKNTGVGALNRYYGLFDNGEIKVRGIELRQKNSPKFLKKLQKDIIKNFSRAENKEEFLKLIPEAIEISKRYAEKILNGKIPKEDLIIKSCASRDISQYKVNTFLKSALIQLRKEGIDLEPGQHVRYLVCDEKEKNPFSRVCIAENINKSEKIDTDFYIRQIAQYTESILVPFGFTIERIFDIIKKANKGRELNRTFSKRNRTCQTSF